MIPLCVAASAQEDSQAVDMFSVIAIMIFSQQPIAPVIEGVASYYNIASSSNLTASGEPMVDEAFTCAMRTGKFGTHYRVTAENGKSVVVRLNDRGPYIDGRVIDLSEGAMRQLDPTAEQGLLNVRIERIPEAAIPRLFESRKG